MGMEPPSGPIVAAEDREVGRVTGATYLAYARGGGPRLSIGVAVCCTRAPAGHVGRTGGWYVEVAENTNTEQKRTKKNKGGREHDLVGHQMWYTIFSPDPEYGLREDPGGGR